MQGTSRGGADLREIVRRIDLWGLTHLYVVGGNGGNAAANAIHQELEAAGVVCAVIGVPKSIDNDILLVSMFYSPSTCNLMLQSFRAKGRFIGRFKASFTGSAAANSIYQELF